VPDIEQAMAALKARGAPLLDERPRPGAGGAKVAFVHPKGSRGVLVELRQGPTSERP
jgi:methylmalonyl-CoA/ethylmalonyl-CoA epimerase